MTLTPEDLTDTTVNTDYGTITVARALLALWNRYGWPSDDTLQTIAEEQGVYPPAATSPAEELRTAASRLRQMRFPAAMTATSSTAALIGARLPLADWLELFANTEFDPEATIQETDRSHECALAVARQINGGQP